MLAVETSEIIQRFMGLIRGCIAQSVRCRELEDERVESALRRLRADGLADC